MNPEPVEPIIIPSDRSGLKLGLKILVGATLTILFALLAMTTYLANLNQPTPIAEPISVVIEDGDTVPVITDKLESAGVVQSSELLYVILVFMFDATDIKASRYVFTAPMSTYQVAQRLIEGDFDSDLRDITVFEGESREKIADRLVGEYYWFDAGDFLRLSENLEGQLFPETYFIPRQYSNEAFVTLLHETYLKVIAEYENQIATSGLTENEVITLASIVEREANSEDSMNLVAGIFLNRLAIDMALQADASIEYVLEHELHELAPGQLATSLREIDSPYNTYLYSGLPPTPIGNPGRMAIEAVLNPTKSDYLYYITGNDGNFYYAETYNEHLSNIQRFLR
jgi:UPF0755 protein